ncbi:hypothetical protein HYC85_021789 [Camellia sinensis]|uniref:Fe2OG dioxygenase domain-containing protein n=1 Tax=Camellia sinensis TaxID=4442 RepID=A0A7J7GIK0_CAMSI|nr:hypothetical protein HYC85_021789 [Camellia sinensis]
MSPTMVMTVETRKEDDELESQYQKGVKHLSDNGIERLPNKYILPVSERPNLLLIKELAYACKHSNLTLPVIDFAELQGPNRSQALDSLANACEHYGFFQEFRQQIMPVVLVLMISHGVFWLHDDEVLWLVGSISLLSCLDWVSYGGCSVGWIMLHNLGGSKVWGTLDILVAQVCWVEGLPCCVERHAELHQVRWLVLHQKWKLSCHWCDEVPQMHHNWNAVTVLVEIDSNINWVSQYISTCCWKLAVTYANENKYLFLKLMEAIEESLGLTTTTTKNKKTDDSDGDGDGDGDDILEELKDGSQLMVVNCYPPCPEPHLTLGMPPHSDYGFLTLLLQDEVPGLQIQFQQKWLTIEPIPNSFVVNVGDHLEIFSNGRYKSVLHRAIVNPTKSRISVASLHSVPLKTILRPSPKLITKANPRRYMDTDFATFLKYVSSCEPKTKNFLDSRKLNG